MQDSRLGETGYPERPQRSSGDQQMCAMKAEPDTRFPESDPRHHTARLKGMLDETINHAREDVEKVEDPQARAIFEMTAEVLEGVKRTYEHYESGRERAFARDRG